MRDETELPPEAVLDRALPRPLLLLLPCPPLPPVVTLFMLAVVLAALPAAKLFFLVGLPPRL